MSIENKIKNATPSNWLTEDLSPTEIKFRKELALVSAKIEFKRNELGLTQKEFANIMGVSQSMVSKWESGEYNFSLATLADICEKLNMVFVPEIKEVG